MSTAVRYAFSSVHSGVIYVRANSALWAIDLAKIERTGVYSPKLDRDNRTVHFRWWDGPFSKGCQITLDTPDVAKKLLDMLV